MTESEDGWEGGSGDEEQSEEGDDEGQVVEKSGSHTSVTPIFCVCPRGTRRTQFGHVLMTPNLSVGNTN
jgi:hypothetical protein